MVLVAIVLMCSWVWPLAAAAQPASAADETVVAVQVHGNVLTPSDEIIALAGIQVGAPFDAATLEAVAGRLRGAARFARVDVLKRFASIADPSRVVLVIVVDEGPVTIERTGDPAAPTRVTRSRGLRLLYLPIVRWDEGYGVSYGLRVTHPDPLGPKSRVSVPVTWGGERRVGVQADRTFDRGPVRRLEAGASLTRRRHPHYRVADVRRRADVRLETRAVGSARADVTGAWEHVRFGGQPDRLVRFGAGVTLDTRIDPQLARQAVFARVASERVWSRERGAITTSVVDLRGYVGLVGPSVLVVRAYRDGASAARPAFEQRMIGGHDILRGLRFGRAVGDTLSAGSLELRTPVTSPLSFAKLGVSVFLDAAAVYDGGRRIGDQKFERGVGAGLWFSAAFVRVNLAVARGLGRSTRFHLGTSLLF